MSIFVKFFRTHAVSDVESPPMTDTLDSLLHSEVIENLLVESPTDADVALPSFEAPTPSVSEDCRLYNVLIDGMYDAVLIFDSSGQVIVSNRRATQLFGHPKSDFWGIRSEQLIEGVDLKVLHRIRTHLDTGRFTMLSAVCRRQDDTTFSGEIAISIINFLNEGDLLFSIRNVERRMVAKDHQSSMEDTMRYMHTAAFCCNRLGRLTYINDAFLKCFRYSRETDILTRHLSEFWATRDSDILMRKGLANESWTGALMALTSDQQRLPGVATVAAMPGRGGNVVRVIGTFTATPS